MSHCVKVSLSKIKLHICHLLFPTLTASIFGPEDFILGSFLAFPPHIPNIASHIPQCLMANVQTFLPVLSSFSSVPHTFTPQMTEGVLIS